MRDPSLRTAGRYDLSGPLGLLGAKASLRREEMGQIPARHPPILQSLLDQKTSQRSLEESVLIPMGMAVDELPHGFMQRCWHLGPEAHNAMGVGPSRMLRRAKLLQ